MHTPTADSVQTLAGWKPALGVVSIFVDLDPADRGESWRIRLKDGLEPIVHAHDQPAFRATAARVTAQLTTGSERPGAGRFRIGFVEVAADAGSETWFELQAPAVATSVHYGAGPFLTPLVRSLSQICDAGVALVSADKVELYRWRFGVVSRLAELTPAAGDEADWRERKGPMVDPARGTHVSSSGRDQYEQRHADNRLRFLAACGDEARQQGMRAGWEALVCFGDSVHVQAFMQRVGNTRHVGSEDLVGHPQQEIARLAGERLAELSRERERMLVEHAKGTALARDGRGVLGVQSTLDCLMDGRVDHLMYDSGREYWGEVVNGRLTHVPGSGATDVVALTEPLLEQAIRTGATVTAVEQGPADELSEFGGMAALLRY